MNLYITSGTADFLLKLKEKHAGETMVLMNNNESSILVHETNGKTVYSAPRKYEVIDSAGTFRNEGFAVLNNIPVTDEGRPLFEDRFLNRPRMIESEPGFIAIRVLRPVSSNTYIILTIWENESAFLNWQNSKAYDHAHKKRGTEAGIDQTRPNIFESASYVSKYYISE
ncbi:antibiotic biosynthesis monooxygenase family protein [Mesobacillus subterraneus]|uniref:Antibiotic biosynthesis monooxygenase n=1 Tax=Mesobacillus subterraneus TaxID=285983 RepID=A0A3R9FJ82_9BACI|nr:antibiotic biosynthesis monooxygenase [Mesobacillus subterraneus]RSD29290.1 antibiotic biosynthesis monooxygenase [Mesobacillus subterraneus]